MFTILLYVGFALFLIYAIWHGVFLFRHYRDGGALLEKRLG